MSKTTKGVTNTPSPTMPKAASRVQGATARTIGGVVNSGSVVSRMQRAAEKNFGKSGSK